MKHTKTPWKIRAGGEVGTDEEMTAAIFPVTGEENKANAAFIVRAVNNHEQLLDLTIKAYNFLRIELGKDAELVKLLREAIKQAEAE